MKTEYINQLKSFSNKDRKICLIICFKAKTFAVREYATEN